MTREVKIVDKKTGEILRETYVSQERKFWGMFTLADIIKTGSIWVAIIAFVLGMDYRVKYLEQDRVLVAASMVKMTEFVKSSDNFNSTMWGTQFDNGKPINPSYRANNKGYVTP